MKKVLIALITFSLCFSVFGMASAKTRVKGYYKSNGTYVSPHYRTDSDSRFYNNWSTKGNYNPYTGKRGYKTRP